MASLETLRETTHTNIEVVYPPLSKYAYHVLTPETLPDKKDPLRVLIWGHGSLEIPEYGDLVEETKIEILDLQDYADQHQTIVCMPILPRHNGSQTMPPLDAQMLASPTMLHEWDSFYYRPDQDILKSVFRLTQRFTAQGHRFYGKFMIGGISAGANMANRMVLLYPEYFSGVAIPLAGNYCYPETSINGIVLPYPFGVANIGDIPDSRFNADAYRQLPFFLYDGELDTDPYNDPLPFEHIGLNGIKYEQTTALFGKTQYERFQHFGKYLERNGNPVTMKSAKDRGHSLDERTLEEVFGFFE